MSAASRASIRSELRWLTNAAALVDRPDKVEALLVRYQEVSSRLEKAHRGYEKYLALIEDEKEEAATTAAVEADIEQCHEMADRITQRACELQNARTSGLPTGGKPVGWTRPEFAAQLPAIRIPAFEGKMEDWVSFIDLFDSMVHARTDISAALKLAQLLAVLVGEPRDLVGHLSVTDENYEIARDLLIDRYQNVRRLADTLLEKIWNIPRVTQVSDIRIQMLNPVLMATKALGKLGLPVDQWSYMLLNFLLKRLPAEVRARFEHLHGGDSARHLPAYTDLIGFLETECRRADIPVLTPTPQRPPGSSRASVRVGSPRGGQVKSNPRPAAPRQYNVGTADPDPCMYCKEPGHQVSKCRKFLAQRVQGRRNIAKQRGWCFVCLGPHFVRDCAQPQNCRSCGGKHHQILCMNQSGGSNPPQVENDSLASGQSGDERQGPTNRNQEGAPRPERGPMRGPQGGPRAPNAQNYAAVTRTPPPQQGGPTGGCARPNSPLEARRMSPPLAERPRLDTRNPVYGRYRGYRAPETVRAGRRAYQPEWDPLDRYERPPRAERDASQYPC